MEDEDLDELDREPLSERDPDIVDEEEEEEGEELIGEGMEEFAGSCAELAYPAGTTAPSLTWMPMMRQSLLMNASGRVRYPM